MTELPVMNPLETTTPLPQPDFEVSASMINCDIPVFSGLSF